MNLDIIDPFLWVLVVLSFNAKNMRRGKEYCGLLGKDIGVA